MTEKMAVAWVNDKGLKGDHEWSELLDGASILVDGWVIVIRENRTSPDLMDVLAPIDPDERHDCSSSGPKIPLCKEPKPLSIPKTASKETFQEAMESQSLAIQAVYKEAGIKS